MEKTSKTGLAGMGTFTGSGNPAGENPLIPMGALTGRPDRKTIRSFLSAFRAVGFSQYMIYPRSGCELEYLSEEWFDTCAVILEECEKLGFTSVWLYDEFNWPSGQCGGRLMKENPDHALKFLSVCEKNGEYTFGIGSNPAAPDVLDPEAMRKFIEYTHEKYAERFGRYFGSLIKGMFTDEPSFSYVGCCTGEEKLRIPFYPGLEEDYAEMTGSELKKDVVSALRRGGGNFWEPAVGKLLGKRFLDSFVRPVRAWCDRNGLLMTGHLFDEHSLASSLHASGTPMEVTDTFSLPGIDEISTSSTIATVEWLTFGTVEHAIRKNGGGGLAELFALGPCDMTLARIRKQIRLVSMFGIDHYLLAISPIDVRGNACRSKTSYFNCFSPVQPWFPAFGALAADAAVSAAVARKRFIPEIQIRRPAAGVPLRELLSALVHAQRQWTLIGETEAGTAPVVVRMEPEGGVTTEKMPGGPCCRWPIASFLDRLNEVLPRKVEVTEPDGRLAQELFLRTYADGSTEVVNFAASPETRALSLKRNGCCTSFELPRDGVRSFAGWQVEIDRPNLKLLQFDNGVCRIQLDSALDDLVLLLRQREIPVELELDGQRVEAGEPSDALPEGFRELYRATRPFRLEAGEHVLKLTGSFPEYPFLPGAFLAGKIADHGDTVSEYRDDGRGLQNYIGRLIQTGSAEIPCDASRLRLETDGLYTVLYLDGDKIGERLWAPFVWRIPGRFAGKTVQVKIERFTSCGPMFGEERFIHPRPGDSPWIAAYRPSGAVRHPVVEPEFLS